MNVSEGIEIFVLVHLLSISFMALSSMSYLSIESCWLHQHNLSLKLLIVSLQALLLSHGFLYCGDKLTAKLMLIVQVSDLIHSITTVIIFVHIIILIIITRTLMTFSNALHLRCSLRFVIYIGRLS